MQLNPDALGRVEKLSVSLWRVAATAVVPLGPTALPRHPSPSDADTRETSCVGAWSTLRCATWLPF